MRQPLPNMPTPMRFRSSLCRTFIPVLGILAALGLSGSDAEAAPDEIQVYTEELNDPGAFGLELHLNRTIKGTRTPAYTGQMPSHHLSQATPEFSYGITKNLEAGLYLPVAFSPNGNAYLNGLRLRLKFIAPRQPGESWFWGLNGELGHASIRTSESALTLELRPIVGYRDKDWLLSFNPILNMGLDANVSRQPDFKPAFKLTHSVAGSAHAGFEYYGEYGPLRRFVPSNERSHTLYAVCDIASERYDINFGIGRGFVNASDRWVAKAIFAVPFN